MNDSLEAEVPDDGAGFALLDADDHPSAVDIGDLERDHLGSAPFKGSPATENGISSSSDRPRRSARRRKP
jgi:hypothetical protein